MKYRMTNRVFVPCIYNCGDPHVLRLVFDTGAACTTIRSDNLKGLDVHPTGLQRQFKAANGSVLLLHAIDVQQFTVGNIDMGSCIVWTGPSVANLLGVDLLSRLDWRYIAESRFLEIVKPVQDKIPSVLSEFCTEHNLSVDKLINCFPDNWESLSTETLRNLAEFAYNNLK